MKTTKIYLFFVLTLIFSSIFFTFTSNAEASCMDQCGSYLGNSCKTNTVSCGSPGNCRVYSTYTSGSLSCTEYQCDCRLIEQGVSVTSCSGDVNDGNLICNYGSICQVDNGASTNTYTSCVNNSGSVVPNPPPPPESFFTLSVSPGTRSVVNGNTTTYLLTLSPTISASTGLGNERAIGTYVLPLPIPGCPNQASCAYSGDNTMTIGMDTTSGGVDYATPANKTVVVTARNVIPNTYTLGFTAVNTVGQVASASANLVVNPSLPVVSISVSPTSATAPGATTVTWSVANSPTSCTASGGYGSTWSGSKAASGSLVVSGYPNGSYTLSLSCTNASGTASNSAVFTVSATPPPVVDMKGWGNAVPQASPIDGPIAMTVGGVGGLVWSSSNATNCQIFRDGTLVGNFAANGNAGVVMTTTNNHTITCTGLGGTSNTDSVIHTVPTPTNNASCTAISAPATVSIGQTFNTTVTMQNTGGTTWTPSGANNYHLLVSPWSATPWNNARAIVGSTVAPGASYAFTLPVTAPSTPGTYTIGTRMIQEGVEWFGAICNGGSITVNPLTPTVSLSASPTTGASPLTTTLSWSTTNNPASCTAGGGWSGSKTPSGGSQVISGITTGTTYTLVCTNAGGTSTTASVTVTPIGAISVSISANPASMTLPTNATRLTWTTTGNPTSCTASNYWSGSKTASGGFEDRTGMTAGTSVFVITCSKAGVPDTSASVTVTVGAAALTNNSSCTSITAPSSVTPGQTFTGTIVMRNTGTKTWTNIYTSAADQEHKLGSWNPMSNATWGVTRILLPGGASVAPGNSATFTGTFTAPNTPGTYSFDFAMLEEAIEWFGAPCVKSGGITVTAAPTPIAITSFGPYYASITNYPTINNNSVYWTTSGNPTSCVTSGASPWNTQSITPATIPNGNHYQGVYPSVGNYTYTLTCSKAGVPDATATFTVPVSAASGGSGAAFHLNPTTMSFSGTFGGATPNQQILQIVSDGTADVWYTATSNQSWCRINGAASMPGAVAHSPTGQSTPVAITVGAPGVVGVGTQTCVITVTDPAASPTTRTLNVTYTVAPAAVTQYNLTVTKTIGGSVTTTDGLISCGATCVRAYNQGASVTLQAVPDTVQWRFAGWGGACSGTGSCLLTIDGPKTVTAQFKPRALLYQEF